MGGWRALAAAPACEQQQADTRDQPHVGGVEHRPVVDVDEVDDVAVQRAVAEGSIKGAPSETPLTPTWWRWTDGCLRGGS